MQKLLHSQRGCYYAGESVHSTWHLYSPKIMVTIYNHTFRVKYYKNYPEVNVMKGKFLTQEIICDFKEHLIWEKGAQRQWKSILGM